MQLMVEKDADRTTGKDIHFIVNPNLIFLFTLIFTYGYSETAEMGATPNISPLVNATLQFTVEVACSARTLEEGDTKAFIMTLIPLLGRFKAWSKDFDEKTVSPTPSFSAEGLDSVGILYSTLLVKN